MSPQSERPLDVRFWFDPMCPYAWVTSRWLLEVAEYRPLNITWDVMCLGVINEGKEFEPDSQAWFDRTWFASRVIVAAANAHGHEVVSPLYEAIGERLHPGKQGRDDDDMIVVIEEVLAEQGLPAELVDVARETSVDDLVRASTAEAVALVGDSVGTPAMGVADWGIYGPILTRIPRGEDAVAMWDAVLTLGPRDGFWELKRTMNERPQFD